MTTATTGAIVFTDIVGFTQLTDERGDDVALALLERQEQMVRAALPNCSRVVKELGDGLLLWFDSPREAIDTCLRLQAAFDRSEDDEVPLWVRIGMHWGRPAPRGEDLVGHDVNVAARIVDVAAPGELLCSHATVLAAAATLEGIDFVELGPVVMKGIPEPIELYRAERVLRPSPVG